MRLPPSIEISRWRHRPSWTEDAGKASTHRARCVMSTADGHRAWSPKIANVSEFTRTIAACCFASAPVPVRHPTALH